MKNIKKVPILLASTSPRRLFLMNQVGLEVIVQAPPTEEHLAPSETPDHFVRRLAAEKAESVVSIAAKKYPDCLIVAADTIVVSPNGKRVLGKPKDQSDAAKMLKQLSGKAHVVLTGYCILRLSGKPTAIQKKAVRVTSSKVRMRSLSPWMIQRYIKTGEPMDKAGAYAAQGLGMGLIESIEGSYTNVVGLPIAQVLSDFEKSFNLPFLSWL